MHDQALLKRTILALVSDKLEQVTNQWANAKGDLVRAEILLAEYQNQEKDYPSFGPNLGLGGASSAKLSQESLVYQLAAERLLLKEVYEYAIAKL